MSIKSTTFSEQPFPEESGKILKEVVFSPADPSDPPILRFSPIIDTFYKPNKCNNVSVFSESKTNRTRLN